MDTTGLEQAMIRETEANWKTERSHVGRRAVTLYWRLREITENVDKIDGMVARAREWANEDPETRCQAREVVALLYDELGDMVGPENLNAWLAHGLCGAMEHAWIVIEGDPRLVHPNGKMLVDEMPVDERDIAKGNPFAAWRFIIDPYLLDAMPAIMVFSPTSPFQLMYTELNRFRQHPDPPIKPNYMDEMSDARRKMLEDLNDILAEFADENEG